ncbi:MAG: serine hydrolase [Chitinophagaceae bacterium]
MNQSTKQEQRRLFLKQISICVAGTGMMQFIPANVFAGAPMRHGLPRSTPEAQGISSADIMHFVETAEKSNAGLHSFMVIRHGHVVAEGWWSPYNANIAHCLYSLSKNFTSTAIGLAIQEGKLNLADKVVSFFPDDKPASTDGNLSAMTIRDLLTMTSGHEADTFWPMMSSKDGNWVKTYFSIPVKFSPGSHFTYNSGNSYMLSAIITKVMGESMLNYLQPRLFAPLGIKDAAWDTDPRGINIAAAGLRLKTEDIAKFGQLYLQKGMWNGKRILNEKWVEEATSFKVRNDETGTPTKTEDDDIKQGYGYHFWMSRPVAQGAYRAEGAFCQYSIVMPAQDAVIAITAEGVSTHRVMDLCWNLLLPAMKPGVLPANKFSNKILKDKLAGLRLVAPKSKPVSPLSASLSGKQFYMESNSMNVQNITFDFKEKETLFKLKTEKSVFEISCGIEDWILGKTSMPGSPTNVLFGSPLFKSEWKVAASGTWKDDNTFIMIWRFFETPHSDIVTCKFDKDKLEIDYSNSVSRIINTYKDQRPVLKGKQKS